MDSLCCGIISIGNELVLGHTTDTNSTEIALQLWKTGISTRFISVAGDKEEDIIDALQAACTKSTLVFVCGGLSVEDDWVAKKAITRFTGRRLVVSDEILEYINKRTVNNQTATHSYALIPHQSTVIKNPVGLTPGLILKHDNTDFVFLPGNPHELRVVFSDTLPFVRNIFQHTIRKEQRKMAVSGISAETLQKIVKEQVSGFPAVEHGITVLHDSIEILLEANADKQPDAGRMLDNLYASMNERLAVYLLPGTCGLFVEELCARLLSDNDYTISVAESCSGGLLAHRLTNVPGSSKYMNGGIVAYSNKVKVSVLGVPEELINNFGAASKETAQHMAEGIRRITSSDLSVGITGIAGPKGATETKPVGTVFIAVAAESQVICERFLFSGSREEIKKQTTDFALKMLLDVIRSICYKFS